MKSYLTLPLVAIVTLASCQRQTTESTTPAAAVTLESIAFSDHQWTGIAVANDRSIFVNFPRWSETIPMSVGRLVDGVPQPFPNEAMNFWKPGDDPSKAFVCVQALLADAAGKLWVLDPANPQFQGVIEGGPKLMRFDLASGALEKSYAFGPEVAPSGSYLNDLRLDPERGKAYLTDSGEGALIVLDLKSGLARRVLDEHPSTHSEGITLTIAGKPWLQGGEAPQVHSDGIAYHPSSDTVFYQALSGRTMYRISGADLRDESISADDLGSKVKTVGKTGAADGLICDTEGRVLISALEQDAILRTTADGTVETLIQDKAISWPDSFAWGPEGHLYFTSARIHEGSSPSEKYGVHRISID